MNAFHILGGLLAVWALLVSFLGVTRENFPGTAGGERWWSPSRSCSCWQPWARAW